MTKIWISTETSPESSQYFSNILGETIQYLENATRKKVKIHQYNGEFAPVYEDEYLHFHIYSAPKNVSSKKETPSAVSPTPCNRINFLGRMRYTNTFDMNAIRATSGIAEYIPGPHGFSKKFAQRFGDNVFILHDLQSIFENLNSNNFAYGSKKLRLGSMMAWCLDSEQDRLLLRNSSLQNIANNRHNRFDHMIIFRFLNRALEDAQLDQTMNNIFNEITSLEQLAQGAAVKRLQNQVNISNAEWLESKARMDDLLQDNPEQRLYNIAREDFDRIRSISQIRDVSIVRENNSTYLQFITAPLIMTAHVDANRVQSKYLGIPQVRINLTNTEGRQFVTITNLTSRWDIDRHHSSLINHPHSVSYCCLGSINQSLIEVVKKGEYGAAVDMMMLFLQSFNFTDAWGAQAVIWPEIEMETTPTGIAFAHIPIEETESVVESIPEAIYPTPADQKACGVVYVYDFDNSIENMERVARSIRNHDFSRTAKKIFKDENEARIAEIAFKQFLIVLLENNAPLANISEYVQQMFKRVNNTIIKELCGCRFRYQSNNKDEIVGNPSTFYNSVYGEMPPIEGNIPALVIGSHAEDTDTEVIVNESTGAEVLPNIISVTRHNPEQVNQYDLDQEIELVNESVHDLSL